MANSEAIASTCDCCGTVPKCKATACKSCKLRLEGTCMFGIWGFHSRFVDNQWKYYTLCPDCDKEYWKERNAKRQKREVLYTMWN